MPRVKAEARRHADRSLPFSPSYASALTLASPLQDEAGSVAIFASQLDEALGGGPVQFRQPEVRPGLWIGRAAMQ